MNIGIIGTGARASVYADLCGSDIRGGVLVKALADTDRDRMERFAEKHFKSICIPDMYTDYSLLLDDGSIDAVIICTPDTTHAMIAVETLKHEKHILLEKPLATTIEDCKAVYIESLRHGKVFRMGFVLRYTDIYKKIKEIIMGGELGGIISMEAKEMLGYIHAGSFFRRWHRFSKNNGGFLNAKCSHDLDLMNWMADSDPITVFAAGGRSYFNKRDDAAEKCDVCMLKKTCRYFYRHDDLDPYGYVEDICVFNSDKDIVDHETVSIRYENGITAGFTVSMLSSEADRTMIIFGSDATLFADFARRKIEVRSIYPEGIKIYDYFENVSGHGGGDEGIYIDFIDSIRSGKQDRINYARAGLMSSAIALAGEVSMKEKRAVDLPDYLKI
jgi:predicted dehydrogenase